MQVQENTYKKYFRSITLPADVFGVIGHFMPQEKWACDFHDDAMPLSFQLQVTEDFF